MSFRSMYLSFVFLLDCFILLQAGLVFAAQPEGLLQLPAVQEKKTDAADKPKAGQDSGDHKDFGEVLSAMGKMILNCSVGLFPGG